MRMETKRVLLCRGWRLNPSGAERSLQFKTSWHDRALRESFHLKANLLVSPLMWFTTRIRLHADCSSCRRQVEWMQSDLDGLLLFAVCKRWKVGLWRCHKILGLASPGNWFSAKRRCQQLIFPVSASPEEKSFFYCWKLWQKCLRLQFNSKPEVK